MMLLMIMTYLWGSKQWWSNARRWRGYGSKMRRRRRQEHSWSFKLPRWQSFLVEGCSRVFLGEGWWPFDGCLGSVFSLFSIRSHKDIWRSCQTGMFNMQTSLRDWEQPTGMRSNPRKWNTYSMRISNIYISQIEICHLLNNFFNSGMREKLRTRHLWPLLFNLLNQELSGKGE